MFNRIISFVKEVWSKLMMLNNATVKSALGVESLVSPYMTDAIQRWGLMYTNQASWLNGDVESLQLPATISSELARTVTIEMGVTVTGSPRAEYLSEQFDNMLPVLRDKTEIGLALGGLIMKPYFDGVSLNVDYVRADQFIPIAYDNNRKLNSVIFVSELQKGNKYYTRLEYHSMGIFQNESGKLVKGCSIINLAFKSNNRSSLGQEVSLSEVPEWANIEPSMMVMNIKRPLYGYFRPAGANNVDINDPSSPIGVSCYSRAEKLIKQADIQFSRLLWEFESGERAIFTDQSAFDIDPQTKKPVLPSLKKRLYRTLKRTGGNVGDKQQLFQEFSPQFREASIQSGLDTILKKVELTTGLAFGTISDPNTQPLTATEIVMSKQRTAATVTDNQKALQFALDDVFYAMNIYTDYYNLAPIGTYSVQYDWDDSVVSDKATQFTQDQMVVGMGAMAKAKFLERNYKLTSEIAAEWVQQAQSEQPSIGGGFFGETNTSIEGV